MTAQATTPIQHFIRDLQKRQQSLGEQMQAFELLQQEIARLQQRAPQDAQARQRLIRLSYAMQNEFVPLHQRLQHCAQNLYSQLEALEASLRNTGSPTTKQALAASKRASPLLGRAFF